MYIHAYTLYGGLRPFGVSVLLSTYDKETPELYCIDPSGVSSVSSLHYKDKPLLYGTQNCIQSLVVNNPSFSCHSFIIISIFLELNNIPILYT